MITFSLKLLFSDLRACGVPDDSLALLGQCLSRWSLIDGRGIPQGMSPSDILAKLYLAVPDRALREAGFRHLRYVDDHRIFCEGRPGLKRALLELTRSLRRRGLTFQSAKTEFLPLDRARTHVDGITPALKPLAKGYLEEIARAAGVEAKYLTITEAEDLIERQGAAPPTGMLREAYRVFIEGQESFDKSMFRYLLNRLGRAKDASAVQHVIGLLLERPEETQSILRYLAAVRRLREQEPKLVEITSSPEAIYAYQHYQLILASLEDSGDPSEAMLGFVRRVLAGANTPSYLASVSIAFIAKYGSVADLELQIEAYARAGSEEDRVRLLCSLYRLEPGRRNAIIGQGQPDGFLVEKAARWIRSGQVGESLGRAGAA